MESNLKMGIKMKQLLQLTVLSTAIALAGCGGGGGGGFYGDSGSGSTTGTTTVSGTTTPVDPTTVPSLTIGVNSTLSESDDKVYYLESMSVTVTDASGKPLANQVVKLSITPTRYYKGFYFYTPASTPAGGTAVPASWNVANGTGPYLTGAFSCASEDKNANTVLDAGEDLNGNNKLDPINPVTFVGAASVSNSLPIASFTTDSAGKLDFSVRYAKTYADWVEVNLIASATINGVTSSNNLKFDLLSLVKDFDMTGVAIPPNKYSPYGEASSCTDPK